MVKLLVHGVPDTPYVWSPLLAVLNLEDHEVQTPALPGFAGPPPKGFIPTKDGYVDWLIGEMRRAADAAGEPIDLVGHDWGALLVLRASSLRPELVRSWAVSGAVIDPQYKGHLMAKLWATPLIGETVMWLSPRANLVRALVRGGLPRNVAEHELQFWTKTKRQMTLSLYRSAVGLRFGGPWVDDLASLPERGLVIWGAKDPYVDLQTAERFCNGADVPLRVHGDAGHWSIAEAPEQTAAWLNDFWTTDGLDDYELR